MSLTVRKFGGTSLSTTERIHKAAQLIEEGYQNGEQSVVVVSAQGHTTDELLEKAGQIPGKFNARELDMLLSSGEQISAALTAMTLNSMGIRAVSLLGWQAGIHTMGDYSEAKIKEIDVRRLKEELARNQAVIVAGFQGVNDRGDITTIGRGGSDTSAVALAAALKADVCKIYTDVDGVYSADPHIVPTAKKLSQLNYDEMLELASAGAQVLHNRSVMLAKKYQVELEVVSSFERISGTRIREVAMEQNSLCGTAKDKNVALIKLQAEKGRALDTPQLFALMAGRSISADMVALGPSGKSADFSIQKNRVLDLIELLNEHKEALGLLNFSVNEAVCKVSLIGSGLSLHPGICAKVLKLFSESAVEVIHLTTSEIRISALIPAQAGDKASTLLHQGFFE